MLVLHSWGTTNGRKPIIALEALETLLNAADYFAGSYSIADILMLPHIHRELAEPEHDAAYPRLRAWLARLEARPAVRKGLTLEISAAV